MFGRLTLRCAYHKSSEPVTLWRSSAGFSRCLSSVSHHDEIVSVPVGGNGAVDLIISRPTEPTNDNNVLVYLPPGPILETSRANSSPVTSKILKDAFPTTTIVDIRYRISLLDIANPRGSNSQNKSKNDKTIKPDDRFPTPIHDVFTAWDYITDDLELYNHDIVDGKKVYYEPQICLLGSHIGGALALSLALTNPENVTAVAVLDGMVDWVGLDEIAAGDARASGSEKEIGMDMIAEAAQRKEKEKRRSKSAEREAQRVAARELLRLRRRLFRSPSGYFDAFASPVLFLRAPGRDVPIEPIGDAQGHVIRYGDGTGEVAIVENRNGNDNGNGEAFGPYDDDWHSHASGEETHAKERNTELVEGGAAEQENGTRSSIESDGANVTVNDSSSTTSTSTDTSSSTQPLNPSLPDQRPTPPRRRKVLRRWPPIARPEEVLLPYVNIFSTTSSSSNTSPLRSTTSKNHNGSPKADTLPILNLQAAELQELLRKACFWGRERSIAEERVRLTRIETVKEGEGEVKMDGKDGIGNGQGGDEMFEWLRERFNA